MKDEKRGDGSASAPFNNPFASLSGQRGLLPEGRPAAPSSPKAAGPARAVVRMERKGHGGKEVTVVEKLDLGRAELERWLKELKQALGCGGIIDGGALVLQGDQRQRAKDLLLARGVRKVALG